MIDELRDLEGRGLLRVEQHPDLPLLLWTSAPVPEAAALPQSHVTALDGTTVGRSWPRPLRPGDAGAAPAQPNRKAIAYDKLDGVPVLVTRYEGGLLVWSMNGFHVEDSIRAHLVGWTPGEDETAIFEAISPGLGKVIAHEFDGLVLLGAVQHKTLIDWEAPEMVAQRTGWPGEIVVLRPMPYQWLVDVCADPANGEGREGFVVVQPRPDTSAIRTVIQFEWWKSERASRR